MTEDQLEQEALSWLVETAYRHLCGYDIAPEGPAAERTDYRQPLLIERLRSAIARLNPQVPLVAREDALAQVMDLGIPSMLAANRHFHGLLVNGVPVQYQKDGETCGDFVRLIDWENTLGSNEFLAINQYTNKGPKHARRPDIILLVNGLPLVLLELKNPADENADIWKALDQFQTCKEQIPDLFQYNGVLVISDGSQARMGSLSANAERYMQWRTIDGVALDQLEPLLEGEIRSKFASNIIQQKKFTDLLASVVKRYQNRSNETAQVMEELVEMAKKFRDAARRGETLGLGDDEVKFYDALANNEAAVLELGDETLKKIAHELTEPARQYQRGLVAARKRASQAAHHGQAHPAEIQIPAGPGRRRRAARATTSRGTGGGVGVRHFILPIK